MAGQQELSDATQAKADADLLVVNKLAAVVAAQEELTIAQTNYDTNLISQTTSSGSGLSVDIYNNIISRTPEAWQLCRHDTVSQISANWGSGSVMGCNSDWVTIHYYGTLTVPTSGQYYFRNIADDGFYMTLDGQVVIPEWRDKGCGGNWYPINLEAGHAYTLDAWFYENGGGACSTLYYQNSGNWGVVPAAWFGQTATTIMVNDPALLVIVQEKQLILNQAQQELDAAQIAQQQAQIRLDTATQAMPLLQQAVDDAQALIDAENARILAEQQAAQAQADAEAAALLAEQQAEADRIAQQAAADALAAQQAAQAEADRIAAEQLAQQQAEQAAALQAEADRIAAEQAAIAAQAERDRLAAVAAAEEAARQAQLAAEEAARQAAEAAANATPTPTPTPAPSETTGIIEPTPLPTVEPTEEPVVVPTPEPTVEPTIPPTEEPTSTPTPSSEPTQEPATPEPIPTRTPEQVSTPEVQPEPKLPVDISSIDPQELSSAEVTQLVLAANEVLATAKEGSPEYEKALDALFVAAQADDIQVDPALAAIPGVGQAAVAAIAAINFMGNVGADMAPATREKAKKEVIAAVVATGAAVSAATGAATSAASTGSTGGSGGSSGGSSGGNEKTETNKPNRRETR